MAKFSGTAVRPNAFGPISSTSQRIPTHEGAMGFGRDQKSELFLLAVSNMVKEKTFYEGAGDRDARFRTLVHLITQDDPSWIARFVPFLRDTMQLRSASLVMAAEYVKAGGPNGRSVVESALKRADEPAEMLAYWLQEYGRKLPAPVKRGVADAVKRLYNERAALKYDGVGKAWRMGDVLELVHPKPSAQWQSALFKYLLDRRHNREDVNLEELPFIRGLAKWEANGRPIPLPEGITWERLSGTRKMDKEAWEAVIPQMGYMALLRNLRNFDEAGVSDEIAQGVAQRLADPEQVAKSRQFPIHFFSALKQVSSFRWHQALESALQGSLVNVPSLPGKTLIMVDVSGSMFYDGLSERSTVKRAEIAALFGSALAIRAEHADLVPYSNSIGHVDGLEANTAVLHLTSKRSWCL